MPTSWLYRAIVITSAAEKDALNQVIQANLDPGGLSTFTLGASSDGNEPATHYYCNSLLTIEGVYGIAQFSAMFPSTKVYIWVSHEGGQKAILESILGAISNVTIEDDEKDIDTVMSSESLQRIIPNHG